MKRGEIVQGKVTKVSFPNKGIMETAEGDKLRVKGVLPGQTVSVRVKKSSKEKALGNLLSVDAPSPLEMEEPACVHFGKCGGCTYQSLPYDEQLKLKEGMIHDLMAPVIGEDVWTATYEGIKASPEQFEYRNKMEFSFGDEMKDGPLTLGMHKKGSFYDVVTVDGCRIIDADMRRVLTITLEYFSKEDTIKSKSLLLFDFFASVSISLIKLSREIISSILPLSSTTSSDTIFFSINPLYAL
jgi:tRNA/tmRNA/rRNA uracil-C5-methylase (TrmA/RlmC/RlmD family)